MCILELLQQTFIEFISINHCLWSRRLIYVFVKIFHRNCRTWHGFSLFRFLLFDVFSAMRFPGFFDLRTSYLCLVSYLRFCFVLLGFRIQLSLCCSVIFCYLIPNTQWCSVMSQKSEYFSYNSGKTYKFESIFHFNNTYRLECLRWKAACLNVILWCIIVIFIVNGKRVASRKNTYCFTCPPISIDGTIYLSTPEFQVECKVVAASKIMFSDEIGKQSIRWTK
jgi:hypothetical protein